jgi:hypothetical protein
LQLARGYSRIQQRERERERERKRERKREKRERPLEKRGQLGETTTNVADTTEGRDNTDEQRRVSSCKENGKGKRKSGKRNGFDNPANEESIADSHGKPA